MASIRQNKVGKLVHKELANMFTRELPELAQGAMLTVTEVRMSADLSSARIYISIFASAKPDEIMKGIKQATPEIRHRLGLKLRNQLRKIPELHFYIDDSLDRAERIEELLK